MDMKYIFDQCVNALEWAAKRNGTTYEEINVIIFCIIEPLVFIVLCAVIWKQRKIIARARKKGLT